MADSPGDVTRYFCYMVHCANGAYYTGWTTDPLRRVAEHNAGRGARYTRMHGPVALVYVEEAADHVSALKREVQIKRMGHARKAALAEANPLPEGFAGKMGLNGEGET
jgi:putative endonuclease